MLLVGGLVAAGCILLFKLFAVLVYYFSLFDAASAAADGPVVYFYYVRLADCYAVVVAVCFYYGTDEVPAADLA